MDPASLEIRKANVNREQQALEVTWGDAHESVYPLRTLRGECPCATCRTEREEAKSNPFRVVTKVPSAEMKGVEPVGRYGMRIHWGDGHHAGIYTFEYLRQLCPCEACRAQRPQDETPYVHGIYIPKG